MFFLNNLPRRLPLLALVASTVLCLPGCVPTVWLPDSSGFVYIIPGKGKNPADRGPGQLVHFDLTKNASRVLVNDIGPHTTWPAVSPDGKRIAVGRFKGEPKQTKTVQIVVYDFDGKQVQQSKDLPWSQKVEEKKGISLTGNALPLFWSPKNDMLVVTDFEATGLFNLRTGMMKVIEKSVPIIHGGTPVRPDGKGCLLLVEYKDHPKQPRMVFMEWEGTQHNIDTQALHALEKKKDSKGQGPNIVASTMFLPLIMPSWWDGNSAYAGLKRDKMTYAIDTLQKNVAVSDALKALATTDKKMETVQFDFAGDVSVQVVQSSEDKGGDAKGKQKFNKVVVVNHQTKKEQVLFAKLPADSFGNAFGVMSPNGQYLALCLFSTQGMYQATIAVINHKGELVSKIEI